MKINPIGVLNMCDQIKSGNEQEKEEARAYLIEAIRVYSEFCEKYPGSTAAIILHNRILDIKEVL